MSKLARKTIVLIAGQPKAGTTSLFDWLGQHPEIGAGRLKELRFFTDPDYPLNVPDRFDGTNLDAYLDLFSNRERRVLLDASPDYIGCDTPLALPSIHPDSKAILLFREPVSRMVSAYRYYRSLGLLPADMSFNDYVDKQHCEGIGPGTPSEFRALDHCRREYHIARWRRAFGEGLLVLEFEELRDAPDRVLRQVCRFLGISERAAVPLTQRNKTRGYRSPGLYRIYSGLRRSFAQLTLQAPWIYGALQPVGRLMLKSLESNTENTDRIVVSDRSRKIIAEQTGGA